MPSARVLRSSGVVPRFARRAPLRPVAPTMIGRAIVRDRRLAWVAGEAAPAGRGEGHAVAGDPRGQGRRLGDAEGQAVDRGRFAARRAAARAGRRPPSGPRRRGGRRRSPAARRAVPRSGARSRSRPPPPGRRRGPAGAPGRASKLRSSSAISRRWPIRSAAAAPVWRATSKLLRTSGSIASQSQPSSQGTRTIWAELETGRSSAGPCTMPSAIAPAGRQPPFAQAAGGRRRVSGSAGSRVSACRASRRPGRRSPRRRCSRGSRGVRATFPIRPRPPGRAIRSRSPRGSSRARSAR